MTTVRQAFIADRLPNGNLRFTVNHPEGPAAQCVFNPRDAAAVARAGDWLAENIGSLSPGDLMMLVEERSEGGA